MAAFRKVGGHFYLLFVVLYCCKMIELINLSFSPQNIFATLLFLLVVVYWLTVLVGLLDFGFLDFDLQVDMDVDADMDMDASGDSTSVGWMNSFLYFLNLGRVPFMIWLSFLAIPLWMMVVWFNAFLGIENFILGSFVFLGALIPSAMLAKALTQPFVKVFDKLDQTATSEDMVGKVGIVKLPCTDTKRGQAEIKHNNSFISIQILTKNEFIVNKGDKILVIEQLDDNIYHVEPYNN